VGLEEKETVGGDRKAGGQEARWVGKRGQVDEKGKGGRGE